MKNKILVVGPWIVTETTRKKETNEFLYSILLGIVKVLQIRWKVNNNNLCGSSIRLDGGLENPHPTVEDPHVEEESCRPRCNHKPSDPGRKDRIKMDA